MLLPSPVVVLTGDLDVTELVTWIKAIPLTEWPAGDLTQLRPAMVTDPNWHDLARQTSDLVSYLLSLIGDRTYTAKSRWLSVLMPGHVIEPHADATEPGLVCRVHVPLTTNDHAIMVVNDLPYHLDVGTAYLFDKTARHSVTNDGETPRIHFMFDVIA